MAQAPTIWKNGQIIDPADAVVSVFDHGLLYGDGVFEGVRYFNGRPLRLEPHLQRLRRSAAAIALHIPYPAEVLADAVHETIAAAPSADGYLRILVTRGIGALGVNPAGCTDQSVFIMASQLTVVPKDRLTRGLTAITASTRRIPADSLDPRIKSLNYLNHVLARIEANNAGADEAILLNHQGHVAEASVENLFAWRDGTLITPPTSDGALDGITREAVMELAAAAGMPVHQRSMTLMDLYTADEAFLTGTGAGLLPLRQVDGRDLRQCPGPIFTRLSRAYDNLVRQGTGTRNAAV